MYGRHGGRQGRRVGELGRVAHYAVSGGVHEERGEARRESRQASGGHEPQKHRVFGEAAHWSQVFGNRRGD